MQCLVATNADMDEEWKICMAILHSNAKNYQLWNHRRKCALRMGAANAKREMEFAAAGLEIDAKNYHIWAHRQVHRNFLSFIPYGRFGVPALELACSMWKIAIVTYKHCLQNK